MTIKVRIEIETDKKIKPVGTIRITNTTGPLEGETEFADYAVNYTYSDGADTHFKTRVIRNFPRNEANVLALVLSALHQLDSEDMLRAKGSTEKDDGINVLDKAIERVWTKK